MNTSPAVSQMSSPGIPVDRTNNHIGTGGGSNNNTPNPTVNTNANASADQLLNGQDGANRATLVLTNQPPDNRNGLNALNTNGPTDRTPNGIVTIDRSHIDMNPISGINLNDRLIQERNRQLQERALHERILQDGPRLA